MSLLYTESKICLVLKHYLIQQTFIKLNIYVYFTYTFLKMVLYFRKGLSTQILEIKVPIYANITLQPGQT